MNKKILAVALAILFIATAFTACKTKLDMTEINGQEYPLATDKNGETVVNEENQLAVIVTDREGEVITYENGEDQTYWLQLNGSYVSDDFVQNELYRLNVPKGWTGDSISGRVIKDKTDNKCYIKFVKNTTLKDEETLETYLDIIDEQNEEIAEVINNPDTLAELVAKNPAYAAYEGCKVTYTSDETTIGGVYNGEIRTYKIVNEKGEVVHYAENHYFAVEDVIYSVNYACEGGNGYDESFNFSSYLGDGFTFRDKKK